MVPFQLVNDEEIGELASTNNSSYLDMFRARELLRKKFNNYLNQQLFTSNLDCRILFLLKRYASYGFLLRCLYAF